MDSKETTKKNKKRKNKNKNQKAQASASTETESTALVKSSPSAATGANAAARQKASLTSELDQYADILQMMNEAVNKEVTFDAFEECKAKIEKGIQVISEIMEKFENNKLDDFPEVNVGNKPND